MLYQISESCASTRQHNAEDLTHIFNACFKVSHNTVLIGGANEPLYEASQSESKLNCIYFTHDYFASALHEVAHWCIAGAGRRKLQDYGYWYAPDGRNAQQQKQFEAVEVKPQAIEMAFSRACKKPFRVSVDNLNGESVDEAAFAKAVQLQCADYDKQGFPTRATVFIEALSQYYQALQYQEIKT